MIYLGSDHGGYALKEEIKTHLVENGFDVEDLGCHSTESVDYPDYAKPVCQAVRDNAGSFGILICGTGIGMSMAANKMRGIRAALCHDVFSARMTRRHNDAQVLCMGGRVIGPGLALDIVDAFVEGAFDGGRHKRRVDKMMTMENETC